MQVKKGNTGLKSGSRYVTAHRLQNNNVLHKAVRKEIDR
jgi:hypothetical protein